MTSGPNRTFLFAPGDHARRVEKALTMDADAVILDLEDAVALSAKEATRELVVVALRKPRRGRAYVRVNGFATPFCFGDLQAVIGPWLDGIVLPMLEEPGQLIAVDWAMTALERQHGLAERSLDLMPIIETGRGLAGCRALAAAAAALGGRVRRLAFGAGDYTLDLGITWTSDEAELAPARSEVVLASRCAGLEAPIDTVFASLQEPEAFARSCRCGAALGFQGKLCIHPDQLSVANAAFGPAAGEVEWARRIVAAFAEAEAKGVASIQIDGRFVDYPIAARARRIVELAELIASAESPVLP
ncbi:HpcH/HpaI aldolase/citrate lyase family protein [Siccirubricoccus phaeus]|uniref:HpcH/HpaI aldolase/citrate lyase family protein n=1 Tax=Siccirubricoccus phaeus TaxID=2595053 RepID=UPI0011F21DD2|nr:CoA ester lyase [Siccirubricoccus phaeus]